MVKLILPGSQDLHMPQVQMMKMGSNGLRGNDLNDFIKRAGASIAYEMSKVAMSPGEVPIHLIALGATEWFGFNRNFDGFTEDSCKKYHKTFEKHARFYRNHQNKDKKKSYGTIKLAVYNEDMHRIELLIGLNGTKEAAERNGGLVADKELEKLASNLNDFSVSMATQVPYDVCVNCGNKAKTRADYCTGTDEGGQCKYGGVKNKMGLVHEDGSINAVDNPINKWIDLSDVYRGADRTAFVFGKLEKSASARIMGGAELAELAGVTAPLDLSFTNFSDRKLHEQLKIASDLADIEQKYLSNRKTKHADYKGLSTSLAGISGLARDTKQCSQALKALAQQKIAMSLTDFIQFVSNVDRQQAEKTAEALTPYLPKLFTTAYQDQDFLQPALATNPFSVSDKEPNTDLKNWAEKQAINGSLKPQFVERRKWQQAIREERVKTSSSILTPESEAAKGLLLPYALYKIAFLHEIKDSDSDFELTEDLVIRQNYTS